ncbi:MAG: RQC domain-containing protein, partial [Marinoscillum sp.]
LLEEIALYAESAVCRRKQLLHYFGEEWHVENCEACDNCNHPRERFEGTELIRKVIEAVDQTDQRFNMDHIASLLVGKETEHVLSYSHNKLDVFGSGKDHDEHFWKSIIRQTLLNEFIKKDIESPGVFQLAKKGVDFLIDPYKVELVKDHEYETEGEEEEIEKETINTTAYDKTLFDMIKALRKKVAREKDLPPYVIFQEPSMEEMATLYPTSMDDLIKIVGVGESKARKFGKPFLSMIEKYVEENDIITASDVLVKSSGVKSKMKIFIIQQIDRQIDLEEIAEAKDMKYEALVKEIENICYGGTKLNLDYYIDQLLDDDRQDDIYDYFMNAESDSIEVAMEELRDFYSEDEVRLMRIKFMSEYAH